MWGTTGIGYNVKKAQAILGADAKLADAMASWDIVFKPENLARFKDCGVHMLDSADDIMPAALNYLGLNPELEGAGRSGEGRRAADEGPAVRAQIPFVGISQRAGLAARSAWCWAGRATSSRRRSAPPKPRPASRSAMSFPRAGRRCGSTIFAIPKDAKNVAEAHAFIDYMLRPEVAAKNSNFIAYANGNLASQKLIDKAVLEDRSVYPDEATLASLYIITAHDQKTQRLINRLWTRIKTGR